MNTNRFLGYILAFLSGLAIGALAVLFLTPESGAELRGQIREKAGASAQQIRAGFEHSRQWVTDEAGKLHKDKPAEATAETQ
jgi:gas vesicle protein